MILVQVGVNVRGKMTAGQDVIAAPLIQGTCFFLYYSQLITEKWLAYHL